MGPSRPPSSAAGPIQAGCPHHVDEDRVAVEPQVRPGLDGDIVLDELEPRGHGFVRYADDCNPTMAITRVTLALTTALSIDERDLMAISEREPLVRIAGLVLRHRSTSGKPRGHELIHPVGSLEAASGLLLHPQPLVIESRAPRITQAGRGRSPEDRPRRARPDRDMLKQLRPRHRPVGSNHLFGSSRPSP